MDNSNQTKSTDTSQPKTDFHKYSMAGVMDSFTESNIGSFHAEPVSTGFSELDNLLCGGFTAGLILLGALPSMGKSTLALQMAQHIASQGIPTFYYSIEMPKDRIAAKALTRRIFSQTETNMLIPANRFITAKDSTQFSPDEWEQINYAIHQAKHDFSQFYVVEGTGTESVSGSTIYSDISSFLSSPGTLKTPAKAVVFVDYLQLLSASADEKNTRFSDQRIIVDNNIHFLKSLADEYSIPIIIISSLARNKNITGVQMSDFKESGGIEYSADVLMALQFALVTDNPQTAYDTNSINREKSKKIRKLDLVVLKQRYGISGLDARVRFDYNPAGEIFVQESDCFKSLKDTSVSDNTAEAVSPDNADQSGKNKPSNAKQASKSQQTYYINNCQIMHCFYKEGHFTANNPFVVSVNGTSPVTLSVDQELDFCFYDKIVCDAVSTIWQHQKFSHPERTDICLTPSAVFSVMTGNHKSAAMSKERENKLLNILDKLGNTKITLDCTNENKEKITRQILPVSHISGTRNFMLDLTTQPPFYYYASKKKQIINIPAELIACKELHISNTDDVIQIKHLLIHRIEILRNNRNHFNERKIKYYYPDASKKGGFSGLFPIMGIYEKNFASASAWSNKKQTLHKSVCSILDYYCNLKYLEGYIDNSLKKDSAKRGIIDGITINGKIKNPNNIRFNKA